MLYYIPTWASYI